MSFPPFINPMLGRNLGGTWNPSKLGSKLFLWCDAYDAATLTLNAGKVEQWADKSGNARHLTPASGFKPANRIPYSSTGAFGVNKPAVVWDGTDADLATASTSLSFAQVAVVAAYTNGASVWASGYQGLWGGSEVGLISDVAGQSKWSTLNVYDMLAQDGAAEASSNSGVTALPMTSPSIMISRKTTALTAQQFILGRDRSFGGRQWTGPMCEVVITNAAMTDTERRALEGYFAWKWGIASKLPATHPWKSIAP